jgi:hypothetical protein
MDRFSRWSTSSQALLVLGALFAVGAITDAAYGHTTGATVSGILALGMVVRAWVRRT